MNAMSLRLTGVVSDPPPSVDPLHRELRELLAENDRLIERNQRLKRELGAALDRVALLEAGAEPVLTRSVRTLGRLRIDHDRHQISLDGRSAEAPLRMRKILDYLVARPDRVIPSRELAAALGYNGNSSVASLVDRVRHRLAEIGAGEYLRSISGSRGGGGYWITDPDAHP